MNIHHFKKLIFCLVPIVCTSISKVSAQSYTSLGAGTNTGFFSNKFGSTSLMVMGETSFSDLLALHADVRAGLFGSSVGNQGAEKLYEVKMKGWGIDIGPRFYLKHKKKQGPFGFFVQPKIIFRKVTESFSGYQIHESSYYVPLDDPELSTVFLEEKRGTAFGGGLACGWKYNVKHFFYEFGFSADYVKTVYPASPEHAIISSFYNTSDLLTFNFQAKIGFVISKNIPRKAQKEVIPLDK